MRCGQRCGDNALGPTGLIDAGFDVTRRDRIDPNTLGRPGKRKKCLGTLGCPALGPITSFLFLRYRLQSFKVGAEVPHQDGMMFVI